MKSRLFSLLPRFAKVSRSAGFLTLSLASLVAIGVAGVGCSSDDDSPGGGGNPPPNNSTSSELLGQVTGNKTLTKDKTWLIKGTVFVRSGATLTIEKGTTIQGENSSKGVLVIQPGAKIVAEGTADEPIVFTSQLPEGSRRAGDWGGVIILGNAPVNKGTHRVDGLSEGGTFGGNNPTESSGTFRYVRIEYSGIELSPDNEVNGLTLAGVGSGTTIDHVQIRHTKDDCFEFFGGTVNAKYLACQYNEDDGIDWDLGWQGNLQFFVLQQNPATGEEMNGFEADNDEVGSAKEPFSEPKISNVTLCGQNNNAPKAQYGMLLRRNTKGHIYNTVAVGFEAGIDIRDKATAANWGKGLDIRSSIFFGSTGTGLANAIAYPETGSTAPDKDNDKQDDGTLFVEHELLLNSDYKNSDKNPNIAGCFDAVNPVFGPATSLTENASPPPSDAFFDASAAYIGAFKDANDTWATTGKWAVWKAN
ncbi:hypothetical protein LZC95_17425 [Pendulispora brunnea]|uniref:T9SS C-terminal target domain-containing protein n=1 Tax=Pendulispora brunnea TaxID=2905690 RepID=A0ABZ2KNE2_9BACT